MIQEIISGQPPYADLKRECTVIHSITVKREFPIRPVSIPSDNKQANLLWSTLEKCWGFKPETRPSVLAVKEIVSVRASSTSC